MVIPSHDSDSVDDFDDEDEEEEEEGEVEVTAGGVGVRGGPLGAWDGLAVGEKRLSIHRGD